MIRRPPRSTPLYSSAASDVYKRQSYHNKDAIVAAAADNDDNDDEVKDLERVVETDEKLKTNALKYFLLKQSVFYLLRLHHLSQQFN